MPTYLIIILIIYFAINLVFSGVYLADDGSIDVVFFLFVFFGILMIIVAMIVNIRDEKLENSEWWSEKNKKNGIVENKFIENKPKK